MDKFLKILLLCGVLEVMAATNPEDNLNALLQATTSEELQSLSPELKITNDAGQIDLVLFPQVIGYIQEFTISQSNSPLYKALTTDLERQIRILATFAINNEQILRKLDLKYSGRNYENELLKLLQDAYKYLNNK